MVKKETKSPPQKFSETRSKLIRERENKDKTLHNSNVSEAKKNVSDLIVYGEGDVFKLLSKASSKSEGWMKSTKAMQVPTGCVIQVTTQQGDHVAEALTFVPGVKLSGIPGSLVLVSM